MFFLILACLCLGLINWQLMIVVLGIVMLMAYPVLLLVPVIGCVMYFIVKEGKNG